MLDKVLALVSQLQSKGIEIAHLDLGGGIGIKYDDEQTIDIATYVSSVLDKVGDLEIILEPGRAIVGNAGVFVTKVEFLKQNSEHSFAIIDGAMNDLLRPAFYNAIIKYCLLMKTPKVLTQTGIWWGLFARRVIFWPKTENFHCLKVIFWLSCQPVLMGLP